MKVKNILVIGILVLMIVVQAMAAPWFGRGGDSEKNKDGGQDKITKEMQLSSDQLKLLNANRLETEKKQNLIQADLKNAHLELKAELNKETPNMPLVDETINKITHFQREMLINHVQNILKLKTILTKEQLEKMQMRGMRGMGNMNGMGGGSEGRKGNQMKRK